MKKALQKSKVGPAETDAGGADAPAGDANSSAAAAAAAAEPSDVDADAGAGGSSGAAALRPQGSPAKLPPLGQGGADGATYALTGGTFTLNGSPAHQRGVATFEFEALPDGSQLLVPPPTFGQEKEKQTAVVTADTSSAAATSAPKKDVDNPPPKAKVSEDTWTKGFLKACGTISIVVGVTLLGNFVFSGLESDGEEADRADYTAYMLAHKERYNISEEDFASLVDFVGTPIEFDPDSHDRNWGGTNRNSILFTFTIVSTIGYGNFAPSTDGGKIFLMVYAAVGIPLVGSAVGFLAAQFLGVLEWYAVLHMDVVQGAFEHYDEDESGWLCESEFYSALEDLEIHLTPKEVRRVMKNVDDEGDMRIELDEFKAIAAMLNLPLGKAARARYASCFCHQRQTSPARNIGVRSNLSLCACVCSQDAAVDLGCHGRFMALRGLAGVCGARGLDILGRCLLLRGHADDDRPW